MKDTEIASGQPPVRREIRKAGLAAGVLAALAMVTFMMVAGFLEGDGIGAALDPLRAVGTTFRGDAARGGAGTIVWGLALHLLVGAAFGVAFMALAPRDVSRAQGAALGAGCAIFAMAFALTFVPGVASGLREQMSFHGGAWVVAHALFGAVAGGLGPWLGHRFGERSARRTGEGRPSALRPQPRGA